jgi:hypothetical protein
MSVILAITRPNMAQAITIASIKTFMAISFSHYRSQSCF